MAVRRLLRNRALIASGGHSVGDRGAVCVEHQVRGAGRYSQRTSYFYGPDGKHIADEWSFRNLPVTQSATGLAEREDGKDLHGSAF